MTKIDIISGFLGAGKTTLINRLIKEAYSGEKVVLIENEFGEIGVDGGFLKDAGIEISEMNSGCICCSLVGDFSEALKKVKNDFTPDRILIEPSGVGKLSDIIKAVESAKLEDTVLNSATVVVDVNKCKMYMKNFGEFFNDQISNAGCIVFSHTDKTTDAKLSEALNLVREKNESSTIITTPYDKLDIKDIIETIEKKNTLDAHIKQLIEEDECPVCGHHHDHHHHHHGEECDCHDHEHHHHHHDEECDCHDHEHHHHHHDEECDCHDHEHHHHHHDEECDCHDHEHHHHHHGEECDCHDHEHHHHHHDEECDCHDHEHHHHHHDEECDCHDHEHHHHHHGEECDCHNHEHRHHHHHADDVFTSWGRETVKKYSVEDISSVLKELENAEKYGLILRAKGIVESPNGSWVYFDYVPEEPDVRLGSPSSIGKICVIGANINESAIAELFGL